MAFPQNLQPSFRMYIRKQVKTLLKKYVDIGGRVFSCRPHPLLLEHLPCILFYPSDETVDHRNSAPRVNYREYGLIVETLFSEPLDLESLELAEDFLDCRLYEIEYALTHDIALELGDNGLWIQDVALRSIESLKQVYEGTTTIIAVRCTFTIVYLNEMSELDVCNDFRRFENRIVLAPDAVSIDSVKIR